jgi:uncharacterized protein YggE
VDTPGARRGLWLREEHEMKRCLFVALVGLAAGAGVCRAQFGGSAVYGQGGGKARAEQVERAKRVLSAEELPPSGDSMFVEANVLMNVQADAYVAVFGVVREGETAAECVRKVQAAIDEFTKAVKALGVGDNAIFVDFVAQNRIYGFEVAENVAREKPVGFELKKNVLIRFQDRELLDKLVAAAAGAEIFDLIKVDYVVEHPEDVQQRLMEEAARVVKRKRGRYESLLGIKLEAAGQVYAERSAAYYPAEMYDAYTAFEAESVGADAYRQRYVVQSARKSRTFYFNGLDADGFDAVVNADVLEPSVQFTLYLKLRYAIAPSGAERDPAP